MHQCFQTPVIIMQWWFFLCHWVQFYLDFFFVVSLLFFGTLLTSYRSISPVKRKFSFSPFSCFLLTSILSCLSQSAELSAKIVSLRGCVCIKGFVYICVCSVVHEKVWWWHILICLVFMLCAILENHRWIHLRGKIWFLKCDALIYLKTTI